MRRVRMLEEQDAWEREGGFETHAQTLRRLHAGFDSEPLLYRIIPRTIYAGNGYQDGKIEDGSSLFAATTAAVI